MSPVPASALPKHVRDRLPDAPPGRRRAVARDGCTWRCGACGLATSAYAAAERHADEPGHRRIECVLGVA